MALTTGYSNNCTANAGGLALLWVMDVADFTSAAITNDEVTAVVVSGTWKKFEFREDTGQRLNTGELTDSGAFSVEHAINFRTTGIDTQIVQTLHEFAASNPCGMVAIVKDMNGNKWLEGYSSSLLLARPLKLKAGGMDSGTAITDGPGVDFSLGSKDSKYALKYLGADPS